MITLIGVSHHSTSIAAREQLAFTGEVINAALHDLSRQDGVEEAAILSTCNRTEILVFADPLRISPQSLERWWLGYTGAHVREGIYRYTDIDAVRHLYRVACGLDSLVLGEPQILGQLKQAYQSAIEALTLHKVLSRLFESAFMVAKRIRTQTGIGHNTLSIAHCAVVLAKKIFSHLAQARVCLVGAGETIELVLQHLVSNGVRDITILNRSPLRAQALAQSFNCQAGPLSDLPRLVEHSDIIISATNSPLPIISTECVYHGLSKGKHRPVFMVDLAIPRDIEPAVGEHQDIYLYTVDDLQGIVQENRQLREDAAKNAEQAITFEVTAFVTWLRAQKLLETVADFRHFATSIKEQTLQEALEALRRGQCPEQTLHDFAHQFTQKVLHPPTVYLRDASFSQEYDKIALVRKVFEFDRQDEKLYSE